MAKNFEEGFKGATTEIQCLVANILSFEGEEQEKYLAEANKVIAERKKKAS